MFGFTDETPAPATGQNHLALDHSDGEARQPPLGPPVQARPRKTRPMGARATLPSFSAKALLISTSFTPTASRCGLAKVAQSGRVFGSSTTTSA